MALYYGITWHMKQEICKIHLCLQQQLKSESLILASVGYVNQMCVVWDLFKLAGMLQIRIGEQFFSDLLKT